MRSLTCLTLLASLALAPAVRALPSEGSEWYLLETSGLSVLTDGDPDRAEALATELLSFSIGLAAALPAGPAADGRPLLLHVFRDEQSLHDYKPIARGRVSEAAAFFMPRREGAFVAMELSTPSSLRIVRHELVHFALHRLLGGAPPWLDEGLAEYLAAAREDTGGLVLGDPIAEHREHLLRSGLFPVEKLVRMPVFEAAHSGGEQASRLYAESWGLVHFLRTGGEGPRALFDGMFDELARRGPEARDLIELGGFELRALDEALKVHLARETLPTERISVPQRAQSPFIRRRLSREQALSALGELAIAAGRNAEAEQHFEVARSRRDTLARAWRGLGLLREADGLPLEARPLLDRAAALAPEDPEVLLSLGRNLLGVTAPDFDADLVPQGDALRAHEILGKAVALAPTRAESLAALGLAGLMTEKGAGAETGAALEIARELMPHRTDVAYHLMLWKLRRGELEQALALLDEVVLPREEPWSELAVRASNIATSACIERARTLRGGGRSEDAVALLESRLEAGVHEALRPQVLRELQASRPLP